MSFEKRFRAFPSAGERKRALSKRFVFERPCVALGYPMVAPAYAARRSDLAKSLGLGRKSGEQPSAKKANPRSCPANKAAAAAAKA